MEKKSYRVTDLAGTHVAGRRIQDRNAPLLLTEEEARLELVAGTIRLAEAIRKMIDEIAEGLEPAGNEVEAAPAAKPASKRR